MTRLLLLRLRAIALALRVNQNRIEMNDCSKFLLEMQSILGPPDRHVNKFRLKFRFAIVS